MDYRLELLKEYRELLLNWDNNNMLYNSLKFYKIYNGDVEHSELVSTLLCRETGKKNDIMTSWWKPTKYFLFRSIKGTRTELTDKLLSRIPEKADVEELRLSLSTIRYQEENDDDYETILPFWNYGAKNLAAATDSDWKEYFINVKDRIEKRNKRLKKKNIL